MKNTKIVFKILFVMALLGTLLSISVIANAEGTTPVEVTIDWCSDDFTFNNEVQQVTASYKDLSGQVFELEVSIDREFKDVGTYTATITTQELPEGYVLPQVKSKTYTMKQKDISSATIVTSGSLTYTGVEQTIGIESVKVGDLDVTYTIVEGSNVAKDAGTYTLQVNGTGNFTGTASTSFTVQQLQYNTSSLKFENLTVAYDGEKHYLFVSGVPSGVTYELLDENQAPFTGKAAVGTYLVTARFTVDNNHEPIADLTATLSILATELRSNNVVLKVNIPGEEDVFASNLELSVTAKTGEEVYDSHLKNTASFDYYNRLPWERTLLFNEHVAASYNVKLYQIDEEGYSTPINASKINKSAIFTLYLPVPDDVEISEYTYIVGRNAKNETVKIAFNANNVENGYYKLEVTQLMEYAFVYEQLDTMHYFAGIALLVMLVYFVVDCTLFSKKWQWSIPNFLILLAFAGIGVLFVVMTGCVICQIISYSMLLLVLITPICQLFTNTKSIL